MTRVHKLIVMSWADAIRLAVSIGEADAAYRLTRRFVGRLRELGLL